MEVFKKDFSCVKKSFVTIVLAAMHIADTYTGNIGKNFYTIKAV